MLIHTPLPTSKCYGLPMAVGCTSHFIICPGFPPTLNLVVYIALKIAESNEKQQ